MKKNTRTIIIYVAIFAVVILLATILITRSNSTQVTYSDILEKFKNNEVTEFEVAGNNVLTIKTTDNKTYRITIRDIVLFKKDIQSYLDAQSALPESSRTLKKWNIVTSNSVFLAYLPYIIMIGAAIVVYVIFFRRMTSEQNKVQRFSRARITFGQANKSKVYFSDVAGCDEEKEELREVVDYLRNPGKYRELGARIPRGILLVGPPGTGKTLLAKAVAGEAGVPFLSVSGSDFVEMYVGVGASRVRDLFDTAKKAPASIVFIDEIDAVGRHRGAGLGGGHDEREQTLNQLLVEMDGFESHDGVIVMAATNRPDILDPALLRPGRFDRQVTINYPDIEAREAILRVHSKNKPLASDIDFRHVAEVTVGFTGADLANLMNESALLAARKGKRLIDMEDISESIIKIEVGTQKKSRKIKIEDKRKTAYHEAGHALAAYYLPTQDPVKQISIIPSGRALGYTLNPPQEDRYSVYKQQLKENIAMLLAGRAAEETVFGDISGGASNDISRATDIARAMVTQYGMSELGTIRFGSEHDRDEVFLGRDFNSHQDYSDATAAKIDEQIKKFIDEGYSLAKQIVTEHRDKLDFITEFLVENETMDGEEFKAAMEGASAEELKVMAEERRKKLEEENAAKAAVDEQRRREEEERRRKRESEENNHRDRPGMWN
ncbi:MAG: ATP-dependent zinc metalloprotease FtsH [Clostridiales bacterium]|nr:ATP-dependent zinc metalloprotease FtsH [Clostridiales bacterium]